MGIDAQYVVVHDCITCYDIKFLRDFEELESYSKKTGHDIVGSHITIYKRTSAFNEFELQRMREINKEKKNGKQV